LGVGLGVKTDKHKVLYFRPWRGALSGIEGSTDGNIFKRVAVEAVRQ
jgi:hypothetical protein